MPWLGVAWILRISKQHLLMWTLILWLSKCRASGRICPKRIFQHVACVWGPGSCGNHGAVEYPCTLSFHYRALKVVMPTVLKAAFTVVDLDYEVANELLG